MPEPSSPPCFARAMGMEATRSTRSTTGFRRLSREYNAGYLRWRAIDHRYRFLGPFFACGLLTVIIGANCLRGRRSLLIASSYVGINVSRVHLKCRASALKLPALSAYSSCSSHPPILTLCASPIGLEQKWLLLQ